MEDSEETILHHFKDFRVPPDPMLEYDEPPESVLIVDNGSFNCRMGWTHSKPCDKTSESDKFLAYKSVMVKTRKEKGKESELYVANDIPNIEAVRFNLKTPFDRNVVTQFDHEETCLDYGFYHLGIDSGEAIAHPILMTEAPANPSASRSCKFVIIKSKFSVIFLLGLAMNELLFECYGVPKVSYGVDGLFSLYRNQPNFARNKTTSMVISLGFHTVHFLPVVDGVLDAENIRRLNIGGFTLTNYLHRGLQLKYTAHAPNITIGRAEEIISEHCHISKEFSIELREWAKPEYYQTNVHRMQLPFTVAPKPPPVDPEVLRQRRQEMAKRLIEMNAKKREEKLQEDEALLKTLTNCLDLLEQGYDDRVRRMLSKHGLVAKKAKDVEDLIAKTKAKIEKAKNPVSKKKAEPSDKEPEAKKRREDMDDEEKKEFDSWLDDVKTKKRELLEKRSARHLRKDQLSKRRTAASQERMRMISQLAKNSKKDDNFGMNDADWDVYKQIRKDQGDSDSEEEQELLQQYDLILQQHDPDFDKEDEDEISRDSAEWYQLHIATERIRVPEIFFQPSICGSEQAGISETLEFILNKYDSETSQKLASNVFVTGAPAKLPGLLERIASDLQAVRPFKSHSNVIMASNPSFDAFAGMQRFARTETADNFWITKSDYEENGSAYLRTHGCSNVYP